MVRNLFNSKTFTKASEFKFEKVRVFSAMALLHWHFSWTGYDLQENFLLIIVSISCKRKKFFKKFAKRSLLVGTVTEKNAMPQRKLPLTSGA